MARQIHQFRYYGDGNSKNFPATITKSGLINGFTFSDYCPIVQLGVQTIPGMKIYINNHDRPVVVGQTGIYEISVDGMTYITSLQFDNESLSLIDNNQSNLYLIVDILYEGEGA